MKLQSDVHIDKPYFIAYSKVYGMSKLALYDSGDALVPIAMFNLNDVMKEVNRGLDTMTKPFDIYTLEQRLEEKALKVHNAIEKIPVIARPRNSIELTQQKARSLLIAREETINEILKEIRNSRINQRPHCARHND